MTKRNDKRQADRAEKASAAMAATVAPIIDAIERGLADPTEWSAPWHQVDPLDMMPHCPATGRDYTSGNRLALAIVSMTTGAASHWGTFQQWRDMSRHATECNKTATAAGTRREQRPDCGDACQIVSVRRGERAAASIMRPLTGKRTDTKTGEEVTKMFGFAPYAVFHAGQVEGYEMPARPDIEQTPDTEAADVDAAFRFAAMVGARVEVTDTGGASYSPQLDRVKMPDRDRWTTGHGAWSTMAHELTHWTGHADRLARDLTGRFGDDSYAAEELIAELGAAFTLATVGRSAEPRPDHAHYLAAWLRVLKADPRHLWTASSHAERAGQYVTDRAAAAGFALAA